MNSSMGLAFIVVGALVVLSLVQAQNTLGTPGVDYPNYHSIPKTSFSCSDQKYIPGFYADLETKCQAFHFCFQNNQESFLCPTGTIFNQAILACDNWFNSNCTLAPVFYSVNAGPVMESAGKNIPMLLKLRNRSQSKTNVQSLPLTGIEERSLEMDSVQPEHGEKSSLPENFLNGGESKAENEANESSSEERNGETENINVSGNNNNREPGDVLGSDAEENESVIEIDDEMDNLVYDSVTDGYYSDQYEAEWQDSEPESEQFSSFYNYGDVKSEYDKETRDYVYSDYSDQNLEDRNVDESLLEISPFDNIDSLLDTAEFSKRFMRTSQPPKRVRRKPVYVMIDDEADVYDPTRYQRSPYPTEAEYMDSIAMQDTESSSETLSAQGGITESSEEPIQETTSEEPFPRPTRIPPHLLGHSTETPMTSEEFGAAIIEELVVPNLPDDYGTLLASTYPQAQDTPVSEQVDGSPQQEQPQSDDQSVYIEDLTGQEYETYELQDGFNENADSRESDIEVSDEPEAMTDDENTFVVIPDEDEAADSLDEERYEAESLEYSNYYENDAYMEQIDDSGQSISDYGTYENGQEFYNFHAENPELYERYQSPPYRYGGSNMEWPMRRQLYGDVNSESVSPYVTGVPYTDELPFEDEVGFENAPPEIERGILQRFINDAREQGIQYVPQQDQDASYGGYSYDSEGPYSYDNVYNPYTENNEEVSDYSEYSDPESTAWDGQNEEPDALNETGPLPHSEVDVDLETNFKTQVFQGDMMGGFVPEATAQNEEYYVFDFDDEEQQRESEESSLEKKPVDDQSSQAVQSTSKLEHTNVSDPFNSVGNDTLDAGTEESQDSSKTKNGNMWSLNAHLSQMSKTKPSHTVSDEIRLKSLSDTVSLTTESNLQESPVTLSSALERLAALQTIKATQNVGSIGLSNDPRFVNMPESMDFGPYGLGSNRGQQFSMLESLQPGNRFSHRTGESEQSRLSKLSTIQEKMRSMKQGKFGVFKKYMSSGGL